MAWARPASRTVRSDTCIRNLSEPLARPAALAVRSGSSRAPCDAKVDGPDESGLRLSLDGPGARRSHEDDRAVGVDPERAKAGRRKETGPAETAAAVDDDRLPRVESLEGALHQLSKLGGIGRDVTHVIVWEFRVRAEHEAKFEAAYGPRGEWAMLFGASPAYQGTELLSDASTRGRYMTIDRWRSAEWSSSRASDAGRSVWMSRGTQSCRVRPGS